MNKRLLLAASAAACLLSVVQARAASSFDHLRLAADDGDGSFQVASITGHNLRWRYGGGAPVLAFPGCPNQSTALLDGCAAAFAAGGVYEGTTGGDIQHANFFTGYANQSGQVYTAPSGFPAGYRQVGVPWNQFGIDVGAGAPTSKVTIDPWVAAQNGTLPTGCDLGTYSGSTFVPYTALTTAAGQTLPYADLYCGSNTTHGGALYNQPLIVAGYNMGAMPNAATPHGPSRLIIKSNNAPSSYMIMYNKFEADASNPSTTNNDLVEIGAQLPAGCQSGVVRANTFLGHGDQHHNWSTFGINGRACTFQSDHNAFSNMGGRPGTIIMETSTPGQCQSDHDYFDGIETQPGGTHAEVYECVASTPFGPSLTASIGFQYDTCLLGASSGTNIADTCFYLSTGSLYSTTVGTQFWTWTLAQLDHNVAVSNTEAADYLGYILPAGTGAGQSGYSYPTLTSTQMNFGFIGSATGAGASVIQGGVAQGGQVIGGTALTGVTTYSETSNANTLGIDTSEGVYRLNDPNGIITSAIGSSAAPVEFQSFYNTIVGNTLFALSYDFYQNVNIAFNFVDPTGGGVGTCTDTEPYESNNATFMGYVTPGTPDQTTAAYAGKPGTVTIVSFVVGSQIGDLTDFTGNKNGVLLLSGNVSIGVYAEHFGTAWQYPATQPSGSQGDGIDTYNLNTTPSAAYGSASAPVLLGGDFQTANLVNYVSPFINPINLGTNYDLRTGAALTLGATIGYNKCLATPTGGPITF